jgi:hypothetical protein
VIALLAIALAQGPPVTAGAQPLARAVPATEWSCSFEGQDGRRFRLSGVIGAVPKGWDPNRSRPTEIGGDGIAALLGKASATNHYADPDFRDYQISTMSGNETYNVNLKLRRGGPGVGYVTRYVSGPDNQPLHYFSAGLCTSQFDVAPRSTR